MVISTYYALTTLSTTGLGDYYPVSDSERLVASIFFLGGVGLFSYFTGELSYMLAKSLNLDKEISKEDELDDFFTMLMMFNDS